MGIKTTKKEKNEKKKINKKLQKNDFNLLAFGDDENDENEVQNELDTMQKLKKIKEQRNKNKKNEQCESTVSDKIKSSKMMNVIRSKLKSKKKKLSQVNGDKNENEKEIKQRKMSQNDKEYEQLKKQLLKERNDENTKKLDAKDGVYGISHLMRERERYLMKTRMSRTERNKVTAKRLNEFVQIIESAKNEKDC